MWPNCWRSASSGRTDVKRRWTPFLLILFALGCGRPEQPPHLVLLTLDTTRADYLGCYGSSWVETPVFDRIAAEGVRFDDAVCQIPTTLSSHTAILTSKYPRTSGVRSGSVVVPDEVVTLAEHLKSQGYQTAAFLGAVVLEKKYNLHQGFDVYDDGPFRPAERPASETNGKVLEWLEKEFDPKKPLFLWVHYYDPHSPYLPPREWIDKYSPDYQGEIDGSSSQVTRLIASRGQAVNEKDLAHLRALYAGEVSALDEEIGRFLEALGQKLPPEKTLLGLIADHGEMLGEKDRFFHGEDLYEPAMRIPFILNYPGKIPAGTVVKDLVHSLDYAPTVLALAGLPPMEGMEGADLSTAVLTQTEPTRGNLVSFIENEDDRFLDEGDKILGARGHRWKLIQNSNHKRPPILFGRVVNEDLKGPMFAQVFVRESPYASVVAHIRYHTEESYPLRHEYPDLSSIPSTLVNATAMGLDPIHAQAAGDGILGTPASGWRVSVTPNLYERAKDYGLSMGYNTSRMVVESLAVDLASPWSEGEGSAILDNLELVFLPRDAENGKWRKRIVADMESGIAQEALLETRRTPGVEARPSWFQESAFPGPNNLSQRIDLRFGAPPEGPAIDELYDLDSDPEEATNLLIPSDAREMTAEQITQIKDGLEDRLQNWKEGGSAYRPEAAPLSDEERRNLETIGYLR